MRAIVAVVIAVVVGLVVTSPVVASESLDAFSKRVGKYATTDPSKPKGLCWCKDGFGGAGMGEAGYVVQQTGGAVVLSCMIPEFGSDGSFINYVQCVVEWDMLGK